MCDMTLKMTARAQNAETTSRLAHKLSRSAVILAVATLGAFSSGAQADGPGFRPWIGGGIGISQLEPDTSEVPETVTDENSTGFRGMLGLDINHRFGLELSYTDLGEAELSGDNSVSYEQISLDVLAYIFADKSRREHRTGLLPFLRVGATVMENDATVPFIRENNVSLGIGAGLEYGFRSGIAARAEVIGFDFDAQYAGLSLLYRFGGHSEHSPVIQQLQPPVAAALPAAAIVEQRTLGPVLFNFDESTLDVTAKGAVARIAQELKARPAAIAVLKGYADTRGDVAYNIGLSDRRVAQVLSALATHGIDTSRFTTEAMGETGRFGDMQTRYGRHQNRRVEVEIPAQPAQ